MITVSIPNTFIAERTYAVKALLSALCGIEVDILVDPDQQDYLLRWESRSIVIKDYFFGKCSKSDGYATSAHLPSAVKSATTTGLEGIIAIYGEEKFEASADQIVCHVDLFAGVFFMLTRWEESLEGPRDQHQRFPASKAAIVKAGFILRPVVDEYAALMRNWLQSLGYAVPEDKATFTVVPVTWICRYIGAASLYGKAWVDDGCSITGSRRPGEIIKNIKRYCGVNARIRLTLTIT